MKKALCLQDLGFKFGLHSAKVNSASGKQIVIRVRMGGELVGLTAVPLNLAKNPLPYSTRYGHGSSL